MNTLVAENSYQRILHALQNRNYTKAEQITTFAIKDKPLDAQLWAYLGYALSEQGYGISAKKLYQRAQLLDPQADWIERSIQTVKGQRHKKMIDQLLRVKHVTVTAGILVKDEERSIERCISSLLEAVDEIVVIDTGSTDRTIEIVKSFPQVMLVEFPWCDDFGAARNFGLQHMTSDWVLWVDADEYLHPEDKRSIHCIAALFNDCDPPAILKIGQLNQVENSLQINYEQSRMFPLRHGLRYWGRIHEQVGSAEGNFYTGAFLRTAVRIRLNHDGYQTSIKQSKNKLERNIKLLQKMVEDEPNNPTWLFFLGRETLATKTNIDAAIDLLRRADEKASSVSWFGSKLSILNYLIKAYLAKEDLQAAEDACNRALEIESNFPDAWYFLAQIKSRKAKTLYQLAEDNAKKAKDSFNIYRDTVSPDYDILDWKADSNLADIALFSGNVIKARAMYQELLNKKPDLESSQTHLQYIETVRKELNRTCF